MPAVEARPLVTPSTSMPWLGVPAIVAIAAALRWPALFTDFWLDEILSYERFAIAARSISEIFLGAAFRHDNNHHLNTVWMYLFRDHDGWAIYRLPSLAAGLLTVALAAVIGGRRSRSNAVFAGLLVALSFLFVVYSTEARGFAPMLFFALLAYRELIRFLDTRHAGPAVRFSIWIALGLASHLSIWQFYAGALLWSGYRLHGRIADIVRLHAAPIVIGVLWAALVLRGGVVSGGDPWTWRALSDDLLAWTIGYPPRTIWPGLALAALTALVVWDLRRLAREGSDEWLLYLGVIAGSVAVTAAFAPPFLYPRYFLVPALLVLLSAARTLSRWWDRRPRARLAAAALVALFAVGHVTHAVRFWRDGRGHAAHAIAQMAERTPMDRLVVGTLSPDVRSMHSISFYQRKLRLAKPITFVPRQRLGEDSAAVKSTGWCVVLSEEDAARAPAVIEVGTAGRFLLVQTYPKYGPSGQVWFVYRREGR